MPPAPIVCGTREPWSPPWTSPAAWNTWSTSGTSPAVEAAFSAVVEEHGHLDVVVHAAGVAGGGPVHLRRADEWDRVVDVNLKGTFIVDKHCSQPHAGPGTRLDHQHRQHRGAGGHRGWQRLQRLQGRRGHADQVHGHRLRPTGHPGELHLPRGHRHPHARGPSPTSTAWSSTGTSCATSTCWAGSAGRRRSPPPRPSWPRRTPRSSPGTPWSSTEGSPPDSGSACSSRWACNVIPSIPDRTVRPGGRHE